MLQRVASPADDVRRRTGGSPVPVSQIESAREDVKRRGKRSSAAGLPEEPIAWGFSPIVGQTHFRLVPEP
jgi:hypothetical protein